MKYKKLVTLLILSLFVLSGCSLSSPTPSIAQLNVYKGSCHVIGTDVYFAYNGASLIAKDQVAGYKSQNKQNGIDITVIALKDGSFIIPNN